MAKDNPVYPAEDVMRAGKPMRALNDAEIANLNSVKAAGRDFFDLVARMPASREISLAKTKIEEAVMWAVKGITE